MKKIIKLGVLFLLVSSVNATVPSKERQLTKVGINDVVSDGKGSIIKDKKILYDKVVLAKKGRGKVGGSRSMTPAEKKRLAIGEAVIGGAKRVVGDGVLRCLVETWVLSALVGGALLGVKYWSGYFVDANYVDDEMLFDLVVENQEPEVMKVLVDSEANVDYLSVDNDVPFDKVLERDLVLSEEELEGVFFSDDLNTFKRVAWENMGVIEHEVLAGACVYNSLKIASYLIEKGANVDSRDENNSLFHIAVGMRNPQIVEQAKLESCVSGRHRGLLCDALGKGDFSFIKLLIDAGADVNVKDGYGRTPLFYALGDISLVKLLIEAGADIDSRSKRGRTAIEYGLRLSTLDHFSFEEKENILKVVDYLRSVVEERGGII